MPATIICVAEAEPTGFHEASVAGFSVRLSYESQYRIEKNDTDVVRREKEDSAKAAYRSFLEFDKRKVHFAAYQRTGDRLKLVSLAHAQQAHFDRDWAIHYTKWLERKSAEYNGRAFYAAPAAAEVETLSANDVRAVHLIQGTGTWTAPVPQKLGITYVVRLDAGSVKPGGKLLSDLVIVPFFDYTATPAEEYELDTTSSSDTARFGYTAGIDGDRTFCQTKIVIDVVAFDETSLVDFESGFVKVDPQSPSFYEAVKRLEQRAGSLLAVLPALQALEWPKGASDKAVVRRHVWRVLTTLAASLDSVFLALTMPAPDGATSREGPIVAPLVSILAKALSSASPTDPSPADLLKALQSILGKLPVFTEPTDRTLYATALARAVGLDPLPAAAENLGNSATPLLHFGLLMFQRYAAGTDLVEDDLTLFKKLVFGSEITGTDGKTLPISELEARTSMTVHEKAATEILKICAAVQSEDEVEKTILRLLDSGGAGDKAIDDAFAAAFPGIGTAGKTCADAREQYRLVLAGNFNGAEAVRQATSSVYLDFLLSPWPRDTGELRKRLSESQLFVARAGIPLSSEGPPDAGGEGKDASAKTILPELIERFVRPARDWLVADEDTKNAVAALGTTFEEAVTELMPPTTGRRFVPSHGPRALPLQVILDQNTRDMDDFNNQFAGVSLLVRRKDSAGTQDEDWSYANLAALTLAQFDTPPTLDDFSVHPLHAVQVDGRRQVFLEYAGTPFTTNAFDDTLPADNEPSGRSVFYSIDYPELQNVPHGFQKLPALAYGAEFDVVGHVISKGGVLPRALQDSADAEPWKPKATLSTNDFLPYVHRFLYSRTTAVGRTLVTEGLQARIGLAIENVSPLSVDYPRVAVSSSAQTELFLDVMRHGDGRGAIELPKGPFSTSVSLTGLWRWGGMATLKVRLLEAPDALLEDTGLVAVEIPLSVAVSGPLTFTFTRAEGESGRECEFEARLGTSSIRCAFTHSGDVANVWLRLSLASVDTADPSTLSFDDPAAERHAAGSVTQRFPDNLLLVARDDTIDRSRKIWSESVPRVHFARVDFPRVGYADLERWLGNKDLRAQDGVDEDDVQELRGLLLTAYILRTVDEELAARLERLPDLAASHLIFELTPLDGLGDAPEKLLTGPNRPRASHVVVATEPLKRAIAALNEVKKNPEFRLTELLRAIDDKLALEIECAATAGPNLTLVRTGEAISVGVPDGMSVRLTARPLVWEGFFGPSGGGLPSVIDPGMRQLAVGRFTSPDGDHRPYLIFEGASLTIEAMLGPIALERANVPWQVVVNDGAKDRNKVENGWAVLARAAFRHVPAGSARSYYVRMDPHLSGEASSRSWQWRQLGSIDISTQRWRFTGRPIYNWITPPPPRDGAVSSEIPQHHPLLAQFEREAFFDRDDLDADVKTVRLDPSPAATTLAQIDWEKPSATLFRHRLTVRSRYAGAMSKSIHASVQAWLPVVDREQNRQAADSWFRVAMLADRAHLQLSRPQLRALIPLTSAVDSGPRSTPPIAAILQERPFDYGGLADRIAAEVRSGIGYELPAGGKVAPRDVRKELGKDPRLSYKSFDTDGSRSLGVVLEAEGPIGLTFDSASSPAPAFPNCMVVLRPGALAEGRRPADLALEEHFLSVALRRYLDPAWLAEAPISVKTARANETPVLTLAASWWHRIGNIRPAEGQAKTLCKFGLTWSAGSMTVCWIDLDESGVASVYMNPKAVDSTVKEDSRPLEIARMPYNWHTSIALMHVPLEEGRASLSVFAIASDSDDAGPVAGGGNLPVVLATMDWTVPARLETCNVDLVPAGNARLTSASAMTALNWTRTNRDSSVVNAKDIAEKIVVSDLSARIGTYLQLSTEHRPDLWVIPEQWKSDFPLHTQRHMAAWFSELSDGLGRPIEIGMQPQRIVGRKPKVTKAPQGPTQGFLRLVEFETPAQIMGYSPHDALIATRYKAAYFDLVQVGYAAKSFRLSLFMRLIASSAVKASIEGLELQFRNDHMKEGTWLSVPIRKVENEKALFGIQMQISGKPGVPARLLTSLLYDDGTISVPQAVPGDVQFIVNSDAQGFSARIGHTSARGSPEEVWLETSMLLVHRKDEPASKSADDEDHFTHFSFDWLFTGKDDLPEHAVSESALRAMTEAQARIVSVSPPIRITLA